MKSASLFLAASFVLHLAFASPFYFYSQGPQAPVDESILISYVETPQAAPKQFQIEEIPKVFPKPLPGNGIQARKLEKVRASSKINSGKLQTRKAPAIQKSEDILVDPAKGRIFTGYYDVVKKRIRERVKRNYSSENIGQGAVTLFFVLRSDGSLQNAAAVQPSSEADETLKNFAVSCVKASAPFPPFPKELRSGSISFNLTILFEEV